MRIGTRQGYRAASRHDSGHDCAFVLTEPEHLWWTLSIMGSSWASMARLLRRTGFGATGSEIDAAMAAGPLAYIAAIMAADPLTDPGAVATALPAFPAIAPAGKSATKDQRQQVNAQISAQMTSLTTWWIRRMVAVESPFGEKLTFCWHNHFATSSKKVRSAPVMAAQNATLRTQGRGDFHTLALSMLTDAAMLRWLDGELNTTGVANENLSREFMELFALGHGDGYTETDVREGARALTGWRIRADGSTYLDSRRHDSGSKTVLGVTGNLDDVGYCGAVLGASASPRYLATRWWGQLASDAGPSSRVVDSLVSAYGPGRSLSSMYTALLSSPDFDTGAIVVNPVEWLIGAVRALKVPMTTDAAAKKLAAVLNQLGQLPFDPPNVSGWPSGQAWLSTSAADLRLRTATALARGGDVSAVSQASQSSRLDVTAHLLGIASWSSSSAAALKPAIGNPPQLVALALNTPEYLTN
jgi:uncharacterized protein (DUF1800 family)